MKYNIMLRNKNNFHFKLYNNRQRDFKLDKNKVYKNLSADDGRSFKFQNIKQALIFSEYKQVCVFNFNNYLFHQ